MNKKQKNKQNDKNSGEPVHVRLANPLLLRRAVLGAALDSAKVLKSHAEFKSIRETKKELIESLGNVREEILKLTKKLEKELPRVEFQEEHHEIIHVEPKEEKKVEVKAQDAEVDRLKAELEAIEKKLGSL